MTCRMGDLRSKEIINMKDGSRLGFVSDIELDTHAASLTALVVYGRLRLFGLLGRAPDRVIPWKDVILIGDDTILVRCEESGEREEGTLSRFFEKFGEKH